MTRHHHDMTPLDHDNATATVSITGLALGCYNKSTQNYEVGFLRHDNHDLTIEVKKKLDGEESVMLYQIIDHQHRIFIDAENAVSPRDPIYTVGEDFDRTRTDHDPEDFRWVIDFETELNGGNEVELQPPDVPVTEMYVSKPRLYGDKELLTQEQYVRVSLGDDGQPVATEDPAVFGFFTEGIKADITCQDGGAVVLRVDGPQGFQVHLPHGYGPHEITIKNICPPKAASEADDGEEDAGSDDGSASTQPSDFSLYYSLIVDTDGEKFDLQSPVHGEGAVCNGSTLGQRSSLFPLPVSNP
jgi:hypothetical protein